MVESNESDWSQRKKSIAPSALRCRDLAGAFASSSHKAVALGKLLGEVLGDPLGLSEGESLGTLLGEELGKELGVELGSELYHPVETLF